MECNRAKNLLDAFLDGELDPLHSQEVESHLHECRRCTGILESRRKLGDALRTHLPSYPAPDSLRRQILRDVRPASPRRWPALALAACLALAVGGTTWIVATQITHPAPDPAAQLADALESSHIRSLQFAGHLTDVLSSDRHTVKPWFAGKLPYTPPVEKVDEEKFPLVGGRLDVLQGPPVAAIIYQRRQHTINLFVWPSSDNPRPPETLSTPRGHNIIHWTSSGMTWWAVSDVNLDELRTLAALLQHQPPTTAPAH